MMNLLISLTLILSLGFLAACEKDVLHTIEPDFSKDNHQGTGDGGGGNGPKGKSFENFRVDAISIIEKDYILTQIISELKRVFLPLWADMLHVANDRIWYMIPVELNEISPIKLGTFSHSDQIAVQNNKEVYFDRNLYDGMTGLEKTTIILHELLMGSQILKYVGSLDLCLDVAARDFSFAQVYEDRRKKCYTDCQSNFTCEVDGIINVGSRLSPEDYVKIRFLTDYLFRNYSNLDEDFLVSWIKVNKFGLYGK